MGVENDDHIGLDPLCGVARCREDSRSVRTGRCHSLAEPVIPRQHSDGVGQLIGAETDQLLDKCSPGSQPFARARLHVVGGARKHCGQRHSLSDDHQSDDQYEKPFAETTHETDSNARADIVGAQRREPRQFDCRNETSGTQKHGIRKGNRPGHHQEGDLASHRARGMPHCGGHDGHPRCVGRGCHPHHGDLGDRSRFRSRRLRFDHGAVR